MIVFPVVARELRVAARRPWTYWSRLVAGGIALVIAAWLVLLQGEMRLQATGEPLFLMVSGVGLGLVLVAGLLYSADSVSSEKREGTLGLLFLTDLRGLDVTLGKLAANSLGAFYGLLAVMPLLAVTLMMGGVTGGDYARMVLVLIATLFCSLAVGLLASVLTTDIRRSVLLTFLLMLLVVAFGPLLNSSVSWAMGRQGVPAEIISRWERNWTAVASPFAGYIFAQGTSYLRSSQQFWQAVVYLLAVGVLSLAYASWRLPRVWQEKIQGGRTFGIRGALEWLRFPTRTHRDAFRRQLLDASPVAWLSARHWLRAWLVWLLLGGTLLFLGLLGWGWGNDDWWEPQMGVVVALGWHLALKFWVANEAPRQFLDDRRNGALELLLSTSLTVEEVIRGRWTALRRQFLGPLLAVLVADLFWLWRLVQSSGLQDLDEVVWIGLTCMGMLVLDLWAMAWDGLWTGLTSRGRAATAGIVARILVLPWVVWLAAVTGVAMSGIAERWNDEAGTWLLLGSWFSVGTLNDLLWATRARAALTGSFRETVALQPHARAWFRRRTERPAV